MNMVSKLTSLSTIPLLLLLLFAFVPSDQAKKEQTLLKVVIQSLNGNHYEPHAIDNAFSKKIFDLYLERLDVNKRFLLSEDVEKLKQHQSRIDDEILASSLDFFELSYTLINKRLQDADSYFKDILKDPFDFSKQEYYELDGDKIAFVSSKKELRERWRKMLKYETIGRLADLMEEQEKAKEKNDSTFVEKSFAEVEEEAREKVLKNYTDWFHRISKIEKEDRLSYYINTIANVYDPHTTYYPPKDKEDFDIAMSGSLEGIGAQLTQPNEYIKVSRIVPGSPSWKQGELKEGDIILKVAQGAEEPVDVVDMRLDKAVRLIRGPKGTEVRLTVKKVDGEILVIPIIRDVVVLEETYAKSVVIKDNAFNKNIGYILLPSFYVNFKDRRARHASSDIEKELEKLKKQDVDGIIFDLRNDGGGSLQDAVDIAGMFIDKGPIVQVKSRIGPPFIYKDYTPEMEYDGPLVIMVNSFSASASEIFTAAMQDYERGIVLGSNSTFGKGTVQKFADLDRLLKKEYEDVKPLGSIKLTMQKFYRINGGATQLKGVVPDIVLPDNYSFIDIGEKEMDYAMPWDEIKALEYTPFKAEYKLDDIIEEVEEIIEGDTLFQLIQENAQRLKTQRDMTLMPLNLEEFRAMRAERQEKAKRYKHIGKQELNINLESIPQDLEEIEGDTARQELMKAWHKTLQKDVYLLQAIKAVQAFYN